MVRVKFVFGVLAVGVTLAWWQPNSPPEPIQPQHPNGAISLRLTEEQMIYAVAIVGLDGKLRVEEVQGKRNSEARVKSPKRGPDAQ
jgi:hypothetical protein